MHIHYSAPLPASRQTILQQLKTLLFTELQFAMECQSMRMCIFKWLIESECSIWFLSQTARDGVKKELHQDSRSY